MLPAEYMAHEVAPAYGRRSVGNTAAREWFSARSRIRARQPQIAAARVAALVLCSMAAAITGVLLCVQGMRDNNYVPAASYFMLVPLAGLIAGGQHVLSRCW